MGEQGATGARFRKAKKKKEEGTSPRREAEEERNGEVSIAGEAAPPGGRKAVRVLLVLLDRSPVTDVSVFVPVVHTRSHAHGCVAIILAMRGDVSRGEAQGAQKTKGAEGEAGPATRVLDGFRDRR